MQLVKVPYSPVKDTVVVDLSWLMYSSRYALMNLGVVDPATETMIPTGHIHGSLVTITQLSYSCPRVILAVDSVSPHRSEIFSGYKADRAEKRKDEFPIKTHLPLILAAASLIPNVYFVKRDGYEADDLINHLIERGDDPIVYGKDNDLMQWNQPYRMAWDLVASVPRIIDTQVYIREKYGVDLPYLPIWWKVIRGDASDNLPSGVPRYPSKKLVQLCMALKDERYFPALERYVKETMDEKIAPRLEDCRRNLAIVSPLPYTEPLTLKKLMDYPVAVELGKLSMLSMLEFFRGMGVIS